MGRFDETGIAIPHTWEELVALEKELGSYSGATRLREDQEYYDLFLEVIPRDLTLQLIKRQLGDKTVGLVKNNFPYTRILQYLPTVQHYLLWSLKGPVEKEDISELVTERFPGKEWMSFETAPQNKSVPEIWHAHIFLKTV